MERIDTPDKNWKFSADDLKERAQWDAYMKAYEDTLSHTSREWAPWYMIPADHKWFTRVAVADIIVRKLRSLDLHYPKVSEKQRTELRKARRQLQRE
jgi:polyphosphate kinase 2 (PPK2 family)